jgi:hypothetical protein
MENQKTFEEIEEEQAIKAMLKVIPNEAGAISLEDLKEIFSQ